MVPMCTNRTLIPKFIASYSFSNLKPALATYRLFLESDQAVKGEYMYDLWKKIWATKKEILNTVVEALAVCNIDFILNITVLLYIMAILPVTSASGEGGKEGGEGDREG